MIHTMFQKAVNNNHLPKEWADAYITSIFKKRDLRGISVLSTNTKLFGKVIKSKLESTEKKSRDEQV